MGAILSAYREMNCPLFIRIAGKVFRLVVRLAWIVYQGWLLQGGEEWGSCSSTLQDWKDWEVHWLYINREWVDGNIWGRVQKKIWLLSDKPQSSFGARVSIPCKLLLIRLNFVLIPGYSNDIFHCHHPLHHCPHPQHSPWFCWLCWWFWVPFLFCHWSAHQHLVLCWVSGKTSFLSKQISVIYLIGKIKQTKIHFCFIFWSKLMNWVDLLAIIPYYMGLMLTLYKNKVIVGRFSLIHLIL